MSLYALSQSFDDLRTDSDDMPQVKRFSGYFLPATMKLLNAYDRMSSQGIGR